MRCCCMRGLLPPGGAPSPPSLVCSRCGVYELAELVLK